MRTGRYRVRPGFRGVAILQAEYDSPSFFGGVVDASIRQITWEDVQFHHLDSIQFQKLDCVNPKGSQQGEKT